MSDVTRELRLRTAMYGDSVAGDAADEIERLRARLAEAVEALRLSHDALAEFATDESPAGWNAIHAITQINAVLAACKGGSRE